MSGFTLSIAADRSFRSYRLHRDLAILVVTVVICAVPFLSQPFHMDDNFYMDMAHNAQVKSLYPNDTPYVFEGHYLPDMGSHSHPPLQTYFLAILQRFLGEGEGKEWRYRLCALVFPILAVSAFYFLCARWTERPLWPSMVLACCPLFLVTQHTLMTDVPTLAYWLAAIAAFLWAADLGRRSLYAVSSLFQCAALFTSYQSLALIPLLGFYQLRGRGKKIGWLALAAPPVLLAGWFVLNYFHYHRWLLTDTLGYMKSRHAGDLGALVTKVVSLLEYQGWLIIFPFFLLYVLARGLRGRLVWIVFLAAMTMAQVVAPKYRLSDKAILVFGLAAGVFVLLRMGQFLKAGIQSGQVKSGFTPLETQFIGLWYFGVTAYIIFILTEGSARYALPLVPPVLVYFFRRLEILEVPEYRLVPRPFLSSAMVASGSLVVSLAWGLALSDADQQFARVYPRAAREFSEIAGGMDAYCAGEWGFRYYMSRAGIQQLPVDETLVRGGSWIARPRLALPYDPPGALSSMTMPAQTLMYGVRTPLRILDKQTPAGFYSTGWGLIPFTLSRKFLEEVEILQVNFLIERLPWAKVESGSGPSPWPGYLTVEGENLLALLAKPGTRLVFPWTFRDPVIFEFRCAVAPDSYGEGKDGAFRFGACQRDASGRAVSSCSVTLNPGIRKEDRKWQSVQLLLLGAAQMGNALELCFDCRDRNASITGAFAKAFLRPAGNRRSITYD